MKFKKYKIFINRIRSWTSTWSEVRPRPRSAAASTNFSSILEKRKGRLCLCKRFEDTVIVLIHYKRPINFKGRPCLCKKPSRLRSQKLFSKVILIHCKRPNIFRCSCKRFELFKNLTVGLKYTLFFLSFFKFRKFVENYYTLDFFKPFKGKNFFSKQVMFNKTPEQSVVNWADYSLDSNLV